MRILVPGGYGLIGSAIVSALLAAGHEITGLGRSVSQARLMHPRVRWLQCDLNHMTTAQSWLSFLEDTDAVINASGVLQDGPGDDVMATQAGAMVALFQACEQIGISRFVQVSAVGASTEASTIFMRSKGIAEAALKSSSLEWTILRPGLVLGNQVFGGSALLHALASLPLLIVLPPAPPIRVVALEDVAAIAAAAVEGRLPACESYDLVEEESRSLADIVRSLRSHLGLPAVPVLTWPTPVFRALFHLGDLASRFGWKPPLRSTALAQILNGIDGDPSHLRQVTGAPLKSLAQTLEAMDSSARERWFARLFLLKPLIILVLGMFWCASGIIGLFRADAAAQLLASGGFDATSANVLVYGGAIADIGLGGAVLFRRTMRSAALGMIILTLAYLAGGSLSMPALWLDPLGPFVKTIPAATLALVALAISDTR